MEKTTEPSIYILPNGQYKVIVKRTDPRTGKRVQKVKTNPPIYTMKEAIERREALTHLILGVQESTPLRATVASYSIEWLARRSQWLAPTSHNTYKRVIRDKIIPVVGDIYADCVLRRDVQDWVVWAEQQVQPNGDAFAQDTLKKWYRVLVTLLKDLAADFDISDPTVRVSSPRSLVRGVRERQTLTLEQLGALVSAAKTHVPGRYAEIVTLAYTGMRSGELWALHVEDIDASHVHIHRAVSDGVLKDCTKTGWERHVYLPTIAQEAIHEHRQTMLRRRHRGLSTGLLFPSMEGTLRGPGSLTKALRKSKEESGIEQVVSARVLRRTFNTLMVEAGVRHLVLQSQMGHSDIEMTKYYFDGHMEAKERAWEQTFQCA